MANPLGNPIPVGETNTEPVEKTLEYGECPECGGRARSAGETPSKEFFECGCGHSFTEQV